MLADVKGTLAFVTDILRNDVLPYFEDANVEISPENITSITSSFLTVQQSILNLYTNCSNDLESNVALIDQKISDFTANPLGINGIQYRMESDPHLSVNPSSGVGTIWLNIKTGVFFVCVKSETDENLWTGTNGAWRGYNTRLIYDLFNDSSIAEQYPLKEDFLGISGLNPLTLTAGSITYHDDINLEKVARLNGILTFPNYDLIPQSAKNYSFSVFFRPDNTGVNYVLNRDDLSSSSVAGFSFSYNAGTRVLSLKFHTQTLGTFVTFNSQTLLDFNHDELNHIGFTVDKTTLVAKIYHKGKLVSIGQGVPFTEATVSQPRTLKMGAIHTSTSPNYTLTPFYFRQARFFNRALSDEEMLFLSKEGNPL